MKVKAASDNFLFQDYALLETLDNAICHRLSDSVKHSCRSCNDRVGVPQQPNY